jgi:hypothetical protein
MHPDGRKDGTVSNVKKMLAGVAALAALAAGGSVIAGAATSKATTTTATTTQSPPSGQAAPAFPAHGTAEHEAAEKPVTGAAATKAQAAAVAAAGGGTAGAVTTDYSGTGYEVTVKKSDGSEVEIHLDSSFNALQGGRGRGGPPPAAPGA